MRIRHRLASLAALFLLITPVAAMAAVPSDQTSNSSTQTSGNANSQIFGACSQAPNSPVCQSKDQGTKQNPATHLINVAANIVAALTSIGAIIMIIIGGFSYVTAGGSTEQTVSARRQILYSVVGLVVVALAWAITRFITDKVIH